MTTEIRLAVEADLPAINAIYNHFVAISTCTYQMQPTTEEERRAWFAEHAAAVLPVTVATVEGAVRGWGALNPFHRREGYRFTLEDSIYVHPDYPRRGIGRALLSDLLERAAALPCHSVIAIISADQSPSIALHAAAGFVEVGRLREAGHKLGGWLDVLYMQRMLPRSALVPPA